MKSSILLVLAAGFAGFGALEVAALNPGADTDLPSAETAASGTDPVSTPASAPDAGETVKMASADSAAMMAKPAALSETPKALHPGSHDETSSQCLTPALVAAFEPRAAALLERETRLDAREAELAELETSLSARLSELGETRDEIAALTASMDKVAGEDISHLVEMYSTMKPKKAAAIFDRMDPAFAAGFLREIDSARAGTIMAEMGEEQSYRVSLLIASRHAEWRGAQ